MSQYSSSGSVDVAPIVWRPMSMRYPNSCLDCRKRLTPGDDVFYAKPHEKWYFRCQNCQAKAINSGGSVRFPVTSSSSVPVQSPSRSAVRTLSDSSDGSSSPRPSSHTKQMAPVSPHASQRLVLPTPVQISPIRHNLQLPPTITAVRGKTQSYQSPTSKRDREVISQAHIPPSSPSSTTKHRRIVVNPPIHSPMKKNLPIRQFAARMDSVCAACHTFIEEGSMVQGQKPEHGPWIITCFPPCYIEGPDGNHFNRVRDQDEMIQLMQTFYPNAEMYWDDVYDGGNSGDENDEGTDYGEEDDEEYDDEEDQSHQTVDLSEPENKNQENAVHYRNKVTEEDIAVLQKFFDEDEQDEDNHPVHQEKKRRRSATPHTKDAIVIASSDDVECWV